MLHHALAFDSEFVRHVTGDRHGQIISSVRVRFSTEIREAYGKCLQELKDFLFPWAYEARTNTIPEDVLQLAEDESLKDIVGGRQGLVQQFCMWKGLMKLDHPLPPLCIDGSGNKIISPMEYTSQTHWHQLVRSTMH